MKVVLFCGGFGMRLREYAENIPKPLVPVGQRPILWHVMRYYAHWGHKEFILCLGWKGEAIKSYFAEQLQNNEAMQREAGDWKITFVDTGLNSNVGQRLRAVQPLLENEEVFLANYADGLSDLPLPRLIRLFNDRHATAAFVAVHPQQSWHTVDLLPSGAVKNVQPISDGDTWMNGGYFVLGRRIFDVLEQGEELVLEPFQRLIAWQELVALKYDGFWSCMDTYKDKQRLEDMATRGETPWEIWNQAAPIEGLSGVTASSISPIAKA